MVKKTNNTHENGIEKLKLNKKNSIFIKIVKFIFGRTVPQKMFRLYFLAILIGALLLYTPISLLNGYIVHLDPLDPTNLREYKFWDALFIACSAFSDTGLTPAVLSESFTVFGQVVILFLIQLGGIGVISIFFLIWNLLKKWNNVDLNQMIMVQAERGNEKLGNSFRMVRKAVVFILIIELFFAIVFSLWMCFVPAYEQQINLVDGKYGPTYDNPDKLLSCYHNYAKCWWIGLFTSISSINNAGFDIFQGTTSLSSYRNDWNTIFQLFIVIEIVIGGIGYPAIFDIFEKRKNIKKGIQSRVSLFTKVAITAYFLVAIFGLIFAFGFEVIDSAFNTDEYSIFADPNLHHEFGLAPIWNKGFSVFFNVMTTRSAGFSSLDHNLLSSSTKWSNCVLMFIGGSPSSTAGGIRTTTFAIVVLGIINKISGRNNVTMFKRIVPEKKVKDAFIVFVFSLLLIIFICSILPYAQYSQKDLPQFGLLNVFYECTSAFGTVGLSIGITSQINPFGQITLIILMFVGQLGVSSTLLSWTRKNPKGNLAHYPQEDLRIG